MISSESDRDLFFYVLADRIRIRGFSEVGPSVHDEHEQVHSMENEVTVERPSRPKILDETLSEEAKRHAGAGLHRLCD